MLRRQKNNCSKNNEKARVRTGINLLYLSKTAQLELGKNDPDHGPNYASDPIDALRRLSTS